MQLTQIHADWLFRFTLGNVEVENFPTDELVRKEAVLDKEELACELQKENELAKSIARIEAIKADLSDKLELSFKRETEKSAKTRNKNWQDKDADKRPLTQQERLRTEQMTSDSVKTKDPRGRKYEFEAMHAGRITTPLQQDGKPTEFGDRVLRAGNALGPVESETSRLRDLTVTRQVPDETGRLVERKVPLFTDAEIGRAIYAPLERERVVPGTFVPDRYSEDQRMIDGTNALYVEECRKKAGEASKLDMALMVKNVVEGVSALAQAGLGFSEFGLNTVPGMITQAAEFGLKAGVDGVSAVKNAKNKGELNGDDVVKVLAGVGASVGKAAAAKLDNAFHGDFWGQMVTGAARVLNNPQRIYRYFRQDEETRGPFPWAAFMDDVANAVSAGASAASDRSDDVDPTGQSSTGWTFGASLASALNNALQANVPKLQALGLKPLESWRKTILEVVLNGLLEAGKTVADGGAAWRLNITLQTSDAQTINLGQDVAAREKDALATAQEIVKGIFAQAIEEPEEEKNAQPETVDAALKALEAEKKKFAAALERMGETNPDQANGGEAKSIDALIAQIGRDQGWWEKLAVLCATAGAFEQLVAPLRAAGAFAKFMLAARAAYDRNETVSIWLQANEDMDAAMSPYASAVTSLVDNQRLHRNHYVFQSLLQLCQTSSALAEIHVAAQPIALAVGLGIKGLTTLEDSTYKFIKQRKADKAWEVTRKALENPKDRGLAHQALELNPTLAKYSIAYGAVIERNPLAMAAMERCGLDRETLSKPEANVRKVKTYLEKLCGDDSVVLGKAPETERDGKRAKIPEPALTLRSWRSHCHVWAAYDGLVGAPPHAINVGFDLAEKFYALPVEEQKRRLIRTEELEKMIAHLKRAVDTLDAFAPTDYEGRLISSVRPTIKTFRNLFDDKLALLKAERDSRP